MVTQNQIDEIVRIIAAECKPDKVILFGSYAVGTANESSDLDLAIIKPSELPRFKRGREIRSALRANGRRWLFPMDIIVFTPEEMEAHKNDPYSLIHEILSSGKTIYESSQPKRLAA